MNENAGHANADLTSGSRYARDYTAALSDNRATWQRVWETEVGTVVQNDFETVTKRYVVDYLSVANRDILVTEDGSFTQRYVYDAAGKRLSVELDYAPGTARGEAGENPASDIAVNGVGKAWFRTSALNSTLFAVDADGAVVAHMIYDPWGRALLETYTDANFSGLDNLNNFTGYAWDETLGLYYAQNRFYDAATHRFTQEDAVKDGGNWYAYCGNNPLVYVDPWGLRQVVDERGEVTALPSGKVINSTSGGSRSTQPKEEKNWKEKIDETIDRIQAFIGGFGYKTKEELARSGEKWADWENTLDTNAIARIKHLPGDLSKEAFDAAILEIYYDEAKKLQKEYRTLYYGSAGFTLIHETLDPLYTDFMRPSEGHDLREVALQGFLAGFRVGIESAPYIEAILSRYYSKVQCSSAGQATSNTVSVREKLMNSVTDDKLRNCVDQMYRPGATTGDGGLADAIRHELTTGELVGGKSHITKGLERVKNLENIIAKQNLNSVNLQIATDLLSDLKSALALGGY